MDRDKGQQGTLFLIVECQPMTVDRIMEIKIPFVTVIVVIYSGRNNPWMGCLSWWVEVLWVTGFRVISECSLTEDLLITNGK